MNTQIHCPSPQRHQLSALEAAQLLRRHGVDPGEAFAELGHYPIYDAEDVLSWLPEG